MQYLNIIRSGQNKFHAIFFFAAFSLRLTCISLYSWVTFLEKVLVKRSWCLMKEMLKIMVLMQLMLTTLVHMYALPFQDRCRGFPQQLNRREASLHYALTPKETRSGQSAKPMSIPRSWPSLSSPSPSPPSCNVTSLQLPSSELNLNLVKYWCQSFRHSGTPPLFIHP